MIISIQRGPIAWRLEGYDEARRTTTYRTWYIAAGWLHVFVSVVRR